MVKRILALLLCVAMIVSLAPITAVAEEPAVVKSPKAGGHVSEQHKCDECEAVTWQPWPTDGTRPSEGHYYLTQDVQLSGMVSPKANQKLHICLNGFVMKATTNRRLMSASEAGAELVITDCTAYTDENDVYYAGALTGGNSNLKSGGGAVYVATGATFKLYDGRITGNCSKHDEAFGGAIMLATKGANDVPGGKFFMYGGEISNNAAYKADGETLVAGGAIYALAGAQIQINDGIISGNKGKEGAAIYLNSDVEAQITDSTIADNSGGQGGAIYVNTGAEAKLTDCDVTGNTGTSGGAVCVRDGGKLTVDGCEFTGNTGTNGSAIYGTGTGEITIIDCEITGNTGTSTNAQGRCAAVYTDGKASKVNLSGKVIIADNTMAVEGIPDFVMSATLAHTAYIKDLEPGSRINFRTTGFNPTEAGEVLQLDTQQTATWQSSWLTYTNKDGLSKIVGFDGEKFVFLDAPMGHTHGTQEFVALQNGDQLKSGGYFYLDKDVQFTEAAVLDAKNITIELCLNGHSLTPAEGQRLVRLVGTRNIRFVIDDCTAYTDPDGVYHAGRLCGADNEDENGGLMQVGSTDVVTMKNGIISGNKGKSGGAMILDGTFLLEGGQILDNSSVNNGGAVYVNSGGTFKMSGGLMKGNQGKDGGAVYAGGVVEITGGTITGNTASGHGTVTLSGAKAYILKNVTIIENTAQGAAGVYVGSNALSVTLAGSTTITENNGGNLYLTEGLDGVTLADLTGTVGVTLAADRIGAGHMQVTVELPENADPSAQFVSDSPDYVPKLENKRVVLAPSFEHKHCVCGDTACTEHELVDYKPWSDPATLPTAGYYCLTTDVQLSTFVGVNETLYLCLHGHTVTAGPRRIFSAAKDGAKIVLSDCTAKNEDGIYTAGKLTGGKNIYSGGAGAIYVATGAELQLYDGIITNNMHTYNGSGGGAILLDAKTGESTTGGRFYMYGGEISGNKSCNESGEPVRYGGAIAAQRDSVLEIYGGTITGNIGGKGGAIYANSANILIENAVITGNTSTETGGALHIQGETKLTISGKTIITGNTAKDKVNNLELDGELLFSLKDLDPEAAIGVTAVPLRTITEACDDYTANVTSDNTKYQVVYQNGAIYLDATGNHKHCFCNKISDKCDHTVQTYIEWDDPTRLPAAGNYYLTVDVELTTRVGVDSTTLNLCLNGHTITTKDRRAFYMYSDGVLRISDCTENPGKITGATNAAIMADSSCDGALIELWGGILTGNENTSMGGAVMIQGKTTFNMYGGVITGNAVHCKLKVDENGKPVLDDKGSQTVTSTYGGGGVGLNGKETVFNMYGGKITGNETTKAVYLNKDGKETNGGGLGGGVHNNRGSVYIYGGEITKNTTDRSGGGLFTQNAGKMEIHGGKITGNSCSASGGGFYLSSNCFLTFAGGEITGNTAKNAGGFHANSGAQITMTGGTISNNTTTSSGGGIVLSGKNVVMNMQGGEVSGNRGASGAGILAQSGATLNLIGGKVRNNQSKNSGGGIYISGDTFFNMKGGSVTGNTAKSDAGGIMLVRCTASFSGGSVSYNSTEANGGGMKASGAKVNAYGLTMVGNTAKKHAGAIVTGSSSKTTNGVKVTYYLTLNMYNCYFAENVSGSSGGALLLQSKGTVSHLENCNFVNNECKSGGGAFYVSSNVTFSMKGGSASGNYAAAGGAIRMGACDAQLTDVELENNESKQGGGIYVSAEDCKLKLNNVKILNNVCSGTSGGIYLGKAKEVEFTDVVIKGNTVQEKSGGGLYLTGTCRLTMTGGEISDNTCVTMGGAMYVNRGCIVEFNNVNFLGNYSKGSGGAINNGGSLTFNGCRFAENKSGENGGAIYSNMSGNQWTQDRGGVYLNDCEVNDNYAVGLGGALYIHRGGPAHLTNVTFTGNTSENDGFAMYVDGILDMTDVTVTGNKAGSDTGSAVYVGTADWDNHSYTSGRRTLTGNVIIKDNEGGDLFMDKDAVLTVRGATLGENAHICVKLAEGLLTKRLIGVYNYEGGDLSYVVTAGDRSIMEPEFAPETENENQPTETPTTEGNEPAEAGEDNTLLYAGIGGIAAVVILAAIILVVVKKKKSASAESK